MTPAGPLHLFQGYGLELEYMIVDRATLAVKPLADRLLEAMLGTIGPVFENGPIAWSNEIVLHVIELKNNGPTATLLDTAADFQDNVDQINGILESMGAMLLPTGMHPTMDPRHETRLWPHDASPIYAAYDRIFDCRGHGWSNLQSMHLNLPFCGDEEFGCLHAAIRAVLPLLPALCASTPIVEGRVTGTLDNRLQAYRTNQSRIPSIVGKVVPEAVFTPRDYRREILEPSWRDIAPLDPDGLLRSEFLNSRGAIARFERDAIEIRVLDIQEHPLADVARAWLIAETLKALIAERWAPRAALYALDTDALAAVFLAVVQDGERVVVADRALLAVFGRDERALEVGALWEAIAAAVLDPVAAPWQPQRAALDVLFQDGSLARRIVKATGSAPARGRIDEVYHELAACLREGRSFRA